MNYHIITYGCQMNKSDSERIAAILELGGYKVSDDMKKADLLVINSCSVRQSAIDRIFGLVNNLKKLNKKDKAKDIKTILTGCVLVADKKKFAGKFDLVLGIDELEDDPKKLVEFLRLANQEFKAFDYTDYFRINPQYRSKFSAYIPVMTGCNNFCSYCVVPYTRGREISRPAEKIISEVKMLIEKGYKEITLLGQNVNSYKSGTIGFPKLLRSINDIPGDFWIRFLTSHPKDMSDELIETLIKCEKVCEYVHLPIQSGDNEILRKMNRHYTAEHYLNLIEKIRKMYKKDSPLPAISTDIIVGFPGETKKQFQNTAKAMRKVKFDMAYIAEYSPRAGTAAARLEDDISIAEKKSRQKTLNEILKKTALVNNKKYVGKTVEVLIEKSDGNFLYGKTRTFKNVKISISSPLHHSEFISGSGKLGKKEKILKQVQYDRSDIRPGQFAEIKISKATNWGLEGKTIK